MCSKLIIGRIVNPLIILSELDISESTREKLFNCYISDRDYIFNKFGITHNYNVRNFQDITEMINSSLDVPHLKQRLSMYILNKYLEMEDICTFSIIETSGCLRHYDPPKSHDENISVKLSIIYEYHMHLIAEDNLNEKEYISSESISDCQEIKGIEVQGRFKNYPLRIHDKYSLFSLVRSITSNENFYNKQFEILQRLLSLDDIDISIYSR